MTRHDIGTGHGPPRDRGHCNVLAMQLPVERIRPDDAFADEMRALLDELEHTLVDHGWRLAGQGAHWWSKTYRRPALDWDAPAGT